MLQRIQSIYLLLAATISSVFFFVPISKIEINGNSFITKASGIYYLDVEDFVFDQPLLALSSVLLFHVLLSLITIFQFKKRSMQITLSSLNLVLIIIGMGLVFFYADALPEKAIDENVASISYSFGSLLPLLSFVFIFLARKAIIKDDKMVKSADRLR